MNRPWKMVNIVRDGGNYAITYPFFNIDKRDIDLGQVKIPHMGKTPPKNRIEAIYNFICVLLNQQLKNAMSIQTTLNSRNVTNPRNRKKHCLPSRKNRRNPQHQNRAQNTCPCGRI